MDVRPKSSLVDILADILADKLTPTKFFVRLPGTLFSTTNVIHREIVSILFSLGEVITWAELNNLPTFHRTEWHFRFSLWIKFHIDFFIVLMGMLSYNGRVRGWMILTIWRMLSASKMVRSAASIARLPCKINKTLSNSPVAYRMVQLERNSSIEVPSRFLLTWLTSPSFEASASRAVLSNKINDTRFFPPSYLPRE